MVEYGIRADEIARVVGKVISTMINDCLECPNNAEEGSLAIVEPCYGQAHREEDAIDWDGFQRVVIKCAVCKRNVDIMMH